MRDCDRTLHLTDGRALGFAEYGDPAGFPVFYFHGGLSSRIDATSSVPDAADAGIRVIAPDRPGIGLSDRHKGASLLDWPTDVAELASHLGIDRFAVMGWSFGGAYSAACGFALADRVTSTTLIASPIPRDWPGMLDEINKMDRRFLQLSGRAGAIDEAVFLAVGRSAKKSPEKFVERALQGLSPQSQAVIRRDPEEFVAASVDAFVDVGGVLDDYRIWNQPWGFDVSQLAGPVQIWQGGQDELCPSTWGERFANAIPHAELHAVPDAGHFIAHDHWAEIFDSISR